MKYPYAELKVEPNALRPETHIDIVVIIHTSEHALYTRFVQTAPKHTEAKRVELVKAIIRAEGFEFGNDYKSDG